MSNPVQQQTSTSVDRRSPMRSRIAVAQEGRLAPSAGNRLPRATGNLNTSAARDGGLRPTQSRVSGSRVSPHVESHNQAVAGNVGQAAEKISGTPAPKATPRAVLTKADAATIDVSASESENRCLSKSSALSIPKSRNVTATSNVLSATGGLSPSSDGKSALHATSDERRPVRAPSMPVHTPPENRAVSGSQTAWSALKQGGLHNDGKQGGILLGGEAARSTGNNDKDSSGGAKVSAVRNPAAHAGNTPTTHIPVSDALTVDTHDNVSRSRLSAQVLRGILSSSERNAEGSGVARLPNDGGRSSSHQGTASGANPLRHAGHPRRTPDSAEGDEMRRHRSFDYGDEDSLSESTSVGIDGRADDYVTFEGDGAYDAVGNFDEDQSFADKHGAIEWLRVPSLFYFFANLIKWNELQLQRKELMASWQAHQERGDQTSMSLVSVWTQHREQELRTLETHLDFSAFELDGVYLNPVLTRWSKPKLRSLVASVVKTWKEKGPPSPKLDAVLSRLFDAISSEEPCQLHRTCVFSLRHWLGLAENSWFAIAVLIVCFIVAILCIVFLAVFGRTRLPVCIALSAVLGVSVIVMYVLAMFIVHHNTYASAAATYFREAAVRAAQHKMEEEEEWQERNRSRGMDAYFRDEDKYNRAQRHRGGGVDSRDGSESGGSNFTDDQMALAVRNLRTLTEGSAPSAASGAPYYRISGGGQGGKREPGTAAGGYYDDDMTLTDVHAPSLTSRPLPGADSATPPADLDRDNTLLLSTVTYKQHQEYLQQRQSLLLHETMGPANAGGEDGPGSTAARASGEQRKLQRLAALPDKVNITALMYCNNVSVLSEVAPSLWERMFMLLRVADLPALDKAFKHGSERFKVILIHAPDARDGSEELRTALAWLQVERRPVFFISRQSDAFSNLIPTSARLKVPFVSTALDALLLAGIGVEAELSSVSFPADLQQQQSPSQPFQVPAYVLGRRLGGGAFGNVFEAEMEESGAKCAVKRMYLKESSDDEGQEEQNNRSSAPPGASARPSVQGDRAALTQQANPQGGGAQERGSQSSNQNSSDAEGATAAVGSQLREIAQEVEIMSSLQHPNIVRYYFCDRDDNCISIFMELCTGGSLSALIHSGKLVNPPEIKLLLREIVSAVAYLHSLRIVHRDLKPDNVLFRQGHAKITDFGTAVHKHGDDLRLIKGTFAYMAPETLVGEPYGSACDVWSIGCIAAEVLSVELPQHALGLPAMCEYYRAMKKDSTLPIECDVPGVHDFLLACLRRDPTQRSTAAELFYHPMLQARDTSVETWMQKVVEERRQRYNLQHKASHRMGPGSRANGGATGVPAGGASVNGSPAAGVNGGDGFDLSSGNGSVISLDSSQLTGHDGDGDAATLTPRADSLRS